MKNCQEDPYDDLQNAPLKKTAPGAREQPCKKWSCDCKEHACELNCSELNGTTYSQCLGYKTFRCILQLDLAAILAIAMRYCIAA